MVLVAAGAFSYLHPDFIGVPYWLPCIYACASLAVGDMGRHLFLSSTTRGFTWSDLTTGTGHWRHYWYMGMNESEKRGVGVVKVCRRYSLSIRVRRIFITMLRHLTGLSILVCRKKRVRRPLSMRGKGIRMLLL